MRSRHLDNLLSNWAYMVMASLAWSLKAWFGLVLTEKGRWASKHKAEKLAVIRMEFRTFVNAFIRVPAQIIRQGRKTIYRLLAWNPWQVFLRGFDELDKNAMLMNRFDAVKTFPNGFSRELLRVEALFKSDAHAKVANSAYRPSMRLF